MDKFAWGKRLDPSIDTWKGQPAGEVDSIYNGLVSQFEFVGFTDLARQMFKRQMQKFIKNRRYSLMRAANNGEVKLEDCHEVHWKNILKLRSKEVKIRQSAAMKVVRSKQMSQSHAGRGGESIARNILVSYS